MKQIDPAAESSSRRKLLCRKTNTLREAEKKFLSISNQAMRLKEYNSSLEEEVDRLRDKNESIVSLQRTHDEELMMERNLRIEAESSMKDLLVLKEAKEQNILDLRSEVKSLTHQIERINDERANELETTKKLRKRM